MSLTYHCLSQKPKLFRQLTSLSVQEFDILANKLEVEWQNRERERLDYPGRKNEIGQGHPYFGLFTDLLLLLIVYTRTSCSNFLIGILFGITEPTVINLSKRLLPLLQDRFIPNTKLRKAKGKINTIDELIEQYPDLEEVLVDGTGITTRRPKRQQQKNYSGKSKKHEKKTVMIVNQQDGLIVARTALRPGSVHDKRILEEDDLHRQLNNNPSLKKRADSAWTGEDSAIGWLVNKKAKRNHPLTTEDKKENRILSKIRIKVEHAIRKVKVFKRIGDKTAFRAKHKLDQVLNVAINLANFKQLSRFSTTA